MASKITSGSERDQRLNEVLAAYLSAVESGQTVDRQEWLERYPDLANELSQFFANRERIALLDGPANAATLVPQEDSKVAAPEGGHPDWPRFGRYEILAEIARGGMGVVYQARQIGLQRIVALKMILAGALAGSNAIRRFRTEAEAAASFDHPNIVPVYEVGEHEGNPYFTMKLIVGGDLAHWISEVRLPMTKVSRHVQQDIARLLATVARAVHHAHQRGVLHRDLKPANILLQQDPAQPANGDLRAVVPMVTDFGLAKRARADGEVSQSLNIVGTAYYMAPEQAQARGSGLTVAADVYSLGAVLYETLTGRPPFRGDNYLDTLMKVVQDPPAPLRQICPSIYSDLELICLKCLPKAPEERYAGADALAEDLENWAAGEPTSVRPPGRMERVWQRCRRNPLAAMLGFLVVAFLLAGFAYSALVNWRLTAAAEDLNAARDEAVANAATAEANARQAETNAAEAAASSRTAAVARDVAKQALHDAQANLISLHAALVQEKIQREKSRQLLVREYVSNGDGFFDEGDPLGALTWFAEALSLDQGNEVQEQPHRIRLAAALRRCPRLIQVAFHNKKVQVVCLSADGRRTFTSPRDGPARLWDMAADKTWILARRRPPRWANAVFSPDGHFLATGDENGHVRLWNAASGEAIGQAMDHAGPVTHLEFARDGLRLLTASKDGTARVWESPSGNPLSPPLKHGTEVKFASFSQDGRRVATTGIKVAKGPSEVRVWDWAAGTLVGKPLRLVLDGAQAAFSHDDKWLFTSAVNHNLRGWDLATSKSLNLPWSDAPGTGGPWFSPDGQRVLMAKGKLAQVVDLSTGQAVGRPLPHWANVVLAAFSRDGRQVVTAGLDRVVRVWDTQTGQPLTPQLRHARLVLGVALDGHGERLIVNCEDNAVRLWDIRNRDDQAAPPLFLPKAKGDVLAITPGGRSMLALSISTLRVWEIATGKPVTPPLPLSKDTKVTRAAFSPDGKRFVTLDTEALRVWDMTAKQLQGRTLAPSAKIEQIAFSPDGKCVVARLAGGNDLRVWDAATGATIVFGKEQGKSDRKLLFVSPDGRRIATIKLKQQVQIATVAVKPPQTVTIKHIAPVLSVAFSPDGRRLATACADGTVHIWDAKTGEPLTPALPHGPLLQLIGFSLNGHYLVTAGEEGTARVWDAWTGQPVTPVLRHGEPVTGVSFSPEGDGLATLSGKVDIPDKADSLRIRLWDLRPDSRKVADLLLLTKFLSGQQMHAASSSFIPFDAGDLSQTWQQLRAQFPGEFGQQ